MNTAILVSVNRAWRGKVELLVRNPDKKTIPAKESDNHFSILVNHLVNAKKL